MTWLLTLLTPQVKRYLLVAAGIIALIAWLRWDAVRDFKEADLLKSLEDRIETKERADDRRSEIEALDDCELLRDSIERLSGDADAARAEFLRCREGATDGVSADSGILGSQ